MMKPPSVFGADGLLGGQASCLVTASSLESPSGLSVSLASLARLTSHLRVNVLFLGPQVPPA